MALKHECSEAPLFFSMSRRIVLRMYNLGLPLFLTKVSCLVPATRTRTLSRSAILMDCDYTHVNNIRDIDVVVIWTSFRF